MTKNEFEEIYRAHFDYVYCYLLRLCRIQQIAEDITSETFFKALNAIDRFDGKCSINSWLCQIAKNTYYSYLKKNKENVDITLLPDLSDNSVDIEQQFCDQDTSLRVCVALHAIEDPYKEIFYLRVLGELSFRQIAAIYGKNENWACVSYHRARRKIQALLEEQK